MPYVISVELTATRTRAGIVRTDGARQADSDPTPILAMQSDDIAFSSFQHQMGEAIDEIVAIVRRVEHVRATDPRLREVKDIEIAGIGVSIIGEIDVITGNYVSTHYRNIQQPVPFRAQLVSRLHREFGPTKRVGIGNRSNMAAVGEFNYGWGRNKQDWHTMVFMTVGANIGGGLILRDELFVGARGFAGIVGHVVVDRQGPECQSCGQPGCLTMMASGNAMLREALTLVESGKGAQIQSAMVSRASGLDFPDDGGTVSMNSPQAHFDRLDARAIIDAANGGDEAARAIARKAGVYVGRSMTQLIYILNPDAIIVGGIAHSSNDLIDAAAKEVGKNVPHLARNACDIEGSLLGDQASLYGVGYWAAQSTL